MKTEVSHNRRKAISVNPEGQGFCFFLGNGEGMPVKEIQAFMGDGEWGNKREPPATDLAV